MTYNQCYNQSELDEVAGEKPISSLLFLNKDIWLNIEVKDDDILNIYV